MNSRYTRENHTPAQQLAGRRQGLARRHTLLRQAQTILYRADVEAKKQHRAVWCHRHKRTENAMPVFRQFDGAKARLGGVKTCGSVWACPVCAAKVAETRRQELSTAMAAHVAAGGHAYLLTFTFPHYKGQALAELLPGFEKSLQQFQNAKGWKKVMGKDGTAECVGKVNSKEVTYGGANGWHPHLHMLVFCQPGAFGEGAADDAGRLAGPAIDYFRGAWVAKLEKNHLVDGGNRTWADKYALDVRGGAQAAEYIAKWGHEEKWGLSSELTSSHAKTGKRDTWGTTDHYTPFQLLAMSAVGDGHATCAYREFVGAFDGKRMLTWSPGLKAHFGIGDVDDDAAAIEPELGLDDEHEAGVIEQEQLQQLVKWGQLGAFLAFVAEHGHRDDSQAQIDAWIDDCGGGRERSKAILVDRLVIGDHSYFHRPELVE